MKFFEWFNIQPSFLPDENVIRSAYLLNQKKWHPDFFIGIPDQYQLALKNSAFNNQAYKTLTNFISRSSYILEELGFISAIDKNVLPMDFLEEMLELSDSIEETKDDLGKQALEVDLNAKIQKLENEMNAEVSQFSDLLNCNENSLKSLKMQLQQWKYLQRLKKNNANINEM